MTAFRTWKGAEMTESSCKRLRLLVSLLGLLFLLGCAVTEFTHTARFKATSGVNENGAVNLDKDGAEPIISLPAHTDPDLVGGEYEVSWTQGINRGWIITSEPDEQGWKRFSLEYQKAGRLNTVTFLGTYKDRYGNSETFVMTIPVNIYSQPEL